MENTGIDEERHVMDVLALGMGLDDTDPYALNHLFDLVADAIESVPVLEDRDGYAFLMLFHSLRSFSQIQVRIIGMALRGVVVSE